MQKPLLSKILNFKTFLIISLLVSSLGNAQTLQVNILGGAEVTDGLPIIIDAGNSLSFRITNSEIGNCKNLRVEAITASNDFSVSVSSNLPENIKPTAKVCNGTKDLDFTITRTDNACGSLSSTITVKTNNEDITFTLSIERAPIISVLGGSPLADVMNNPTAATTATNGTYFGVVEQGLTETRRFYAINTGSCPLVLNSITSSLANFAITATAFDPYFVDPNLTLEDIPIDPGKGFWFDVAFTAGFPADNDNEAIISITNNTEVAPIFKFNVSAEVYDPSATGPGGFSADFRLWLKTTRGVKKGDSPAFTPVSNTEKVSLWKDLGSTGKNASQTEGTNRPTYYNDPAENINYNPVIKFENDGSINQYLENTVNGFYSQEIFIVMEPDVNVAGSSGMSIFSGTVAGNITPENYVDDLTGVGLGDFTTRLAGEGLWYNQGSAVSNPYYSLTASLDPPPRSYNKAGIINAHNKTATADQGMSILYNTVDDISASTSSSEFTFANLGSVGTSESDLGFIYGTPYNIGKNVSATMGNLNGRVAEIITYAEKLSPTNRQTVESYLAIKYGITLGETEATKNYKNSNGTIIWNVNAGFNHNIAGIGRDDISDLNQKQSKSSNEFNDIDKNSNGTKVVTIGLGTIAATNDANNQ
jgi:hypothetical protein